MCVCVCVCVCVSEDALIKMQISNLHHSRSVFFFGQKKRNIQKPKNIKI